MQSLRNNLIGVDRGQVLMFSDFAEGGPMWTEEGARMVRQEVTFAETYRKAPQVMVSLSMFDMDSATNKRADLQAESISRTGFTIAFKTWGDTRVARARVDWMSIGELAHEDDWNIP
ncbi:MAG: H-type lectin domain-containing protein [Oceanicola sp.]|nr:H-type lectin domain-containing protein [Oceanicola sp.]